MAIIVRYATPIDALGRPKPGWYVIDGRSFCGRYDTQEQAEKNAAAIREMRHASK
jgi:hypothetical protein